MHLFTSPHLLNIYTNAQNTCNVPEWFYQQLWESKVWTHLSIGELRLLCKGALLCPPLSLYSTSLNLDYAHYYDSLTSLM